MSYAEESIYLATVKLKWAEEGFRKSCQEINAKLPTATREEAAQYGKILILEKTLVDDAEDYYKFIINKYRDEVRV